MPIGVLLWIALWTAHTFEDDREGTAGILTFVYGVPTTAAAWAIGVALAALVAARRPV